MSAVTSNMVEIGKTNDLKSGEMKMVMAGEKEILLAHIGDAYYATQNRCPHMGGNLSRGKLEGSIVTCPRHQSQFDLKDGHVVRWTVWPSALVAVDQVRSHKRPLQTYPVTVEGDKVIIKI